MKKKKKNQNIANMNEIHQLKMTRMSPKKIVQMRSGIDLRIFFALQASSGVERKGGGEKNQTNEAMFYRGMLACFFQGLTCFLLASTSKSRQILLRVVDGSMMSSTKPAEPV